MCWGGPVPPCPSRDSAFSFRPREPWSKARPVRPRRRRDGAPASASASGPSLTASRAPCSRPPATRRADEATQQKSDRALVRGPLPPVRTKAEKEDGAKWKAALFTETAATPPRPSRRSSRTGARARRGGAGAAAGDDDATREKTRAPTTSFGTLSRTSPARALCVRVSESSRFDTFILLTILANAVVLCMMEPTKLRAAGAPPNAATSQTRKRAKGKLRARVHGGVHRGDAHQDDRQRRVLRERRLPRDGWNVMDFVVVVVSLVSLAPGAGSNALALRRRALRPLRTLSVLPGMRTLIGTVIRAIPMIGNVILLCVFFFTVFGILGLQLFMGAFRNKCFTARARRDARRTPPTTTSSPASTRRLCSPTTRRSGRTCSWRGTASSTARGGRRRTGRGTRAPTARGAARAEPARRLDSLRRHRARLAHDFPVHHARGVDAHHVRGDGRRHRLVRAVLRAARVHRGLLPPQPRARASSRRCTTRRAPRRAWRRTTRRRRRRGRNFPAPRREAAERAAKRAALVEYLNGANAREGASSGDSDSDEGGGGRGTKRRVACPAEIVRVRGRGACENEENFVENVHLDGAARFGQIGGRASFSACSSRCASC